MIVILTIFQYLIQAVVDLMDKFLITARKLEPVKYTFYTVVTGLVLLLVWPWNYFPLPAHFIFLSRACEESQGGWEIRRGVRQSEPSDFPGEPLQQQQLLREFWHLRL